MKTYRSLISIVSLSFTILLILGFVSSDESPRLKLEKGKLEGKVRISMDKAIHGISGRTLEGQFENNQKRGVWILRDKHYKVLQTREYDNSFEYSIIKNKKVVWSSPRLTRDADGLYKHGELQEKDIAYSLRLWQTIANDELENNNMLNYSLRLIPFASFKAYTDDELRHQDSTNQVKNIDFNSVVNLRIMGDWYYDTKRKISQFEIIAISPVLDHQSTQLWFYYDDMRKALHDIPVESKNKNVLSMDDLFYLGDYGRIMYKVENLTDTAFSEDLREAQTAAVIEDLLKNEAAVWLK